MLLIINAVTYLLCRAWDFDVGTTTNDSIPLLGSYVLALTNPGSTTYLIPGIVTDVSAILVASITFKNNRAGLKIKHRNMEKKERKIKLLTCCKNNIILFLDINLNLIQQLKNVISNKKYMLLVRKQKESRH